MASGIHYEKQNTDQPWNKLVTHVVKKIPIRLPNRTNNHREHQCFNRNFLDYSIDQKMEDPTKTRMILEFLHWMTTVSKKKKQ